MGTKRKMHSQENVVEVLKALLSEESTSTQEEICRKLQQKGFDINQTKVSRLLSKLGAIKLKHEDGKVCYGLAKEPPPPAISSRVSSLVVNVVANESMVVVHTNPGAAPFVARLLDYKQRMTEILATVAGDDTIFIAPKSTKRILKTLEEVKTLLYKKSDLSNSP